jgi:hypothetical protein
MKLDKKLQGPLANKLQLKLDKLGRSLQVMDINIYDMIAARFGDKQPRGGVVFTSSIRHKSTYADNSEYAVIDTYGRGDTHNIIHSGSDFASKYKGNTQGYWNRPTPFPSDITQILSAFKNLKQVKLGCDSDPFMWMDKKYNITLEVLKQLNNSPVETLVIQTRSDLVAHDDYLNAILDLIKSGKNIHVSIYRPVVNSVVCDENLLRLLEPGAPSIKRREHAFNKLKESGVSVGWKNDEVVWTPEIGRATNMMQHQWDTNNINKSFVEVNAPAWRVIMGTQS